MTQYAYAGRADSPIWIGPCESREEAVALARDFYGTPGLVFDPVVAECRPAREGEEGPDGADFVICGPIESV